jgi:hypothetical protein
MSTVHVTPLLGATLLLSILTVRCEDQFAKKNNSTPKTTETNSADSASSASSNKYTGSINNKSWKGKVILPGKITGNLIIHLSGTGSMPINGEFNNLEVSVYESGQ